MIHPESFLVTAKNGPRPAGKPNECFYCNKQVGEEHAQDCVCRKRTVVVEYKFTVCLEFPVDFSDKDIEFNRNDSSWCANNALMELDNTCEAGRCLCPRFEAKYIREATEQDEKTLGIADR